MPANGLGFQHFDAWKSPFRSAEGLISFKPKLHDLPPGYGLAIDETEFGLVLSLEVAKEMVAEVRRVQLRHNVTFRDAQKHLAQRCLADVRLDLAVDRQFIFAVMIGEHLRNREFRKDLIRLNAQLEIEAGETI